MYGRAKAIVCSVTAPWWMPARAHSIHLAFAYKFQVCPYTLRGWRCSLEQSLKFEESLMTKRII